MWCRSWELDLQEYHVLLVTEPFIVNALSCGVVSAAPASSFHVIHFWRKTRHVSVRKVTRYWKIRKKFYLDRKKSIGKFLMQPTSERFPVSPFSSGWCRCFMNSICRDETNVQKMNQAALVQTDKALMALCVGRTFCVVYCLDEKGKAQCGEPTWEHWNSCSNIHWRLHFPLVWFEEVKVAHKLLKVPRSDLSQHCHSDSQAEMRETASEAVTVGSWHANGLIQRMSFFWLLQQTQHLNTP